MSSSQHHRPHLPVRCGHRPPLPWAGLYLALQPPVPAREAAPRGFPAVGPGHGAGGSGQQAARCGGRPRPQLQPAPVTAAAGGGPEVRAGAAAGHGRRGRGGRRLSPQPGLLRRRPQPHPRRQQLPQPAAWTGLSLLPQGGAAPALPDKKGGAGPQPRADKSCGASCFPR